MALQRVCTWYFLPLFASKGVLSKLDKVEKQYRVENQEEDNHGKKK